MLNYKTECVLFSIYESCGEILKCTTESSTPMATWGLGNSGLGAPLFCVLPAHNPVCRGVTPHLKNYVWFSALHDKTSVEGLGHVQRRAAELGKGLEHKSDGQ